MKEKLTIQAQKSKEKKELIFRTAMILFRERGYGATTIRDICREAGISNSTFYHFFGDKSGVLVELYRRLFREREIILVQTPENLRHPFQAIFNYLYHASTLQDLMGREFVRESLLRDQGIIAGQHSSAARQSSMLQIAGFLQAAVNAGVLSQEVHPWFTAEYIMACSSGVIFNWMTVTDNESLTEMMGRILPKAFASITDEQIVIPKSVEMV